MQNSRLRCILLPNSLMEVLRGKEILEVYKDSYPPIHKHLNQSSFARESKLTISCFYHTFLYISSRQRLTSTMGNGLYFLNCHNDQGVERSAIAFYDDLGANNLNVNEQPKAF